MLTLLHGLALFFAGEPYLQRCLTAFMKSYPLCLFSENYAVVPLAKIFFIYLFIFLHPEESPVACEHV